MTYSATQPLKTVMIELTLSSSHSISSGDAVLFDTLRASGSHGVSVNASTGEISLDTSKHYYIQASIDVNRAANPSSWNFAFYDNTSTLISASSGGYDASWDTHTSSTTTGLNATYTAVYQSASPYSSVFLKAVSVAASSTVRIDTSVFILEVDPT